ncbi:MAG: SEC-C metal-binding domain-containing protein, partial [Rikenellaceae bacterium]
VVMDGKIMIVDEQTGRIMDGRRYSDGLHQAIEAKEQVKVEAATQTFATVTLQNYFRMYHKLSGMTGTAETEASEFWSIYKLDVVVIPTNRPIARKDLNDIVYKTKREKYAAVIEEIVKLVGEGRPVLVGTTSVEISELLSRTLKLRGISHNVLNAKQHQQEAQVVQEAGNAGQVTIATNMAGRGTDIKLSAEVKAAGGLAIIGTERHESRRVDRQLRGRAGRQGDPGSSIFYVSLEDNLMRLFGSERIASMMDRMGHKEGDALQAGMMNKAIERAQKKVEENNFGTRKRLIEYDDVMNSQREVIYTLRRHALNGERIEVDINNMVTDYAYNFVQTNIDNDFEDFKLELLKEVALQTTITEEEYKGSNVASLSEKLADDINAHLQHRAKFIADIAIPVLKTVFENHGTMYENIAIPVTDGIKGFNVTIPLKKAVESGGADIYKILSKIVMLITIDENWKEHLRDMDDLKQSVQNASYEQKDPLLIYKFESFELFKKILNKINKECLATLLRSYIPVREGASTEVDRRQSKEVRTVKQQEDVSKLQESRRAAAQNAGQAEKTVTSPIKAEKKVGRNDLCPCGSGLKYKNCHGK